MTVAVGHVVVFVQENHTTDNYFRSMRAWVPTSPPTGRCSPTPQPRISRTTEPPTRSGCTPSRPQPARPPPTPNSTPLPCCPTTPTSPRLEPFWRTTAQGSARTRPPTTCCLSGGRARPCATHPAPKPNRCGTCPRCWDTLANTAWLGRPTPAAPPIQSPSTGSYRAPRTSCAATRSSPTPLICRG